MPVLNQPSDVLATGEESTPGSFVSKQDQQELAAYLLAHVTDKDDVIAINELLCKKLLDSKETKSQIQKSSKLKILNSNGSIKLPVNMLEELIPDTVKRNEIKNELHLGATPTEVPLCYRNILALYFGKLHIEASKCGDALKLGLSSPIGGNICISNPLCTNSVLRYAIEYKSALDYVIAALLSNSVDLIFGTDGTSHLQMSFN